MILAQAAIVQSGPAGLDQLGVERALEVVSCLRTQVSGTPDGGGQKDAGKVEPGGLGWSSGVTAASSSVAMPPPGPDAHFGSSSLTSSAMNSKKLTTMSGVPAETLAQDGVLRGHAHRAGVEVTDAHHYAALDHEGAVEKPYSSAEQRRHHHVAAVFMDPSTWRTTRSRRPLRNSVCCVSARPIPQGPPAWLGGAHGRSPRAPSLAEMSTTSACALATPRPRATPVSATQFYVDTGTGIGIFRS